MKSDFQSYRRARVVQDVLSAVAGSKELLAQLEAHTRRRSAFTEPENVADPRAWIAVSADTIKSAEKSGEVLVSWSSLRLCHLEARIALLNGTKKIRNLPLVKSNGRCCLGKVLWDPYCRLLSRRWFEKTSNAFWAATRLEQDMCTITKMRRRRAIVIHRTYSALFDRIERCT